MYVMLQIINSTQEDIDIIFSLYEAGTQYQKKVAGKHWKGFDRVLIETDISEQRLFKIVEDERIACIFSITLQDPFIWKEKDKDPAVYIHRIATHPDFRGNGYVRHIVQWAREYAVRTGKNYIRMDTGSGNDKLNNYYISCGFNYLGVTAPVATDELPAHYKDGASSLFEIAL